jgi:malic enzyme
LKAPRDVDEADVVIVGGGPAGMAAAIRIKQMCAKQGSTFSYFLFFFFVFFFFCFDSLPNQINF